MDPNQYQLLLKQALDGNYYMKVSDLKTKWKITGATRKFKSDPEILFLPQFRLAGKRHELVYFLERLGYTSDQIHNILLLSYNSTNYNVPESQGGRKEAFDVEVKSLRSTLGKNKRKQPLSKIISLNEMYTLLSSYKKK
jgi:hypothetical protein